MRHSDKTLSTYMLFVYAEQFSDDKSCLSISEQTKFALF